VRTPVNENMWTFPSAGGAGGSPSGHDGGIISVAPGFIKCQIAAIILRGLEEAASSCSFSLAGHPRWRRGVCVCVCV